MRAAAPAAPHVGLAGEDPQAASIGATEEVVDRSESDRDACSSADGVQLNEQLMRNQGALREQLADAQGREAKLADKAADLDEHSLPSDCMLMIPASPTNDRRQTSRSSCAT